MTATSSAPGSAGTIDTPAVATDLASKTGRTSGRLIGALFLGGFLTYGIGFALVTSVTDGPDFLPDVSTHQTTLALGVVLMLLNTAVDIGKGVLFFPVVEPHGRRTAVTYLSAMIFEVSLMAVGALALLSLVPLSDQLEKGQIDAALAGSLGDLALDANLMAYQVGQAGLAFGAFFLCVLLYRVGLVPRFLAAWGAVGYVLHFSGAVAELLGQHVSNVALIPGGLFEVTLGIWLLVKGFRPVTVQGS